MAEQLASLNVQIRHDMEQAEAKIERANKLVRELRGTGLLTGRVVLGPFFTGTYEPGFGPQDSGQVTQAALLVSKGFGVCYWDTEEFWELGQTPEGLDSHARRRFQAFNDCSPAEKKFLLPFVEEMLEDLIDVAMVAASKLEPEPRISVDAYFAQRTSRTRRPRR
jgi:hypothetical protein